LAPALSFPTRRSSDLAQIQREPTIQDRGLITSFARRTEANPRTERPRACFTDDLVIFYTVISSSSCHSSFPIHLYQSQITYAHRDRKSTRLNSSHVAI